MKYSVGDVVVVRPDLTSGWAYDMCTFVDSMEKYRGMSAVIETARRTSRGDRYRISIDGNTWWWSNSMFEDITNEELDTSDFDLMDLLEGG